MIFGYEPEEQQGIRDGDLVSVILLDRDYPSYYKKLMEDKQKKLDEASAILGIKPEKINISAKEAGLVFNYAIIDKLNPDTGNVENVVFVENQTLKLPSFNVFGRITQHIPKYIYENKLGFNTVIKGGINRRFQTSGQIVISQHFPATLPEKDWESGISADEVTPDKVNQYRYLLLREKKRRDNWQMILDKWESESEESATCKLEDMISSRYLLYHAKDDSKEVKYIKPSKGMIFTAKVKRNGKYIDLLAFEYNKNKGEYDYYSHGTDYPQEEDLLLAENLISARDDYFKSLADKHKETVEEQPF